MKFIIVLVAISLVAAKPADDYSKYDNFDADELINNERLLKAYTNCFLGVGKCTPEGTDLKGWIPESMENKCAKCSEKQKALVGKVMIAIQEKLAAEWEKLNKMYNPEGKFNESLKEFLDKYGH